MQTYNPTLLTKGVRGLFTRALSTLGQQSYVDALATRAPSNSDRETYAWLGQAPQMEEIGSAADQTQSGQPTPNIRALSDASYSITNKKFATSMLVSRDQLDDDQIGALDLRVRQMVQVAIQHRDALLTEVITGGTSGTGYDGAAFFANSHPVRGQESAAQDNLLGGSGNSTSQVSNDINTAIAAMMNFVGENGEPFHSMPTQFVLMAPPAFRKPVLEALNAGIVSNTSNVQAEGINIRPVFNARLTSADVNDWYLFHVGGIVRPFIFQDRRPLALEVLDEGERAVMQEQYIYKVSARYNVGYGFWQDAVKVVNT